MGVYSLSKKEGLRVSVCVCMSTYVCVHMYVYVCGVVCVYIRERKGPTPFLKDGFHMCHTCLACFLLHFLELSLGFSDF